VTPGEIIAHVVVILVCLALSGFFSGSEVALLRLRPHEVEESGNDATGFAIRDLLRSTSRLLVTILLGNNVVNILGAAMATTLAVTFLGEGLGVLTATIVMTLLVLIFAEVLPKAYGAHYPDRLAHRVALPLYLFHQVMRPLHRLVDRALDPVIGRVAGAEFEELDAGASNDRTGVAERVLRLASGSLKHTAALDIIGATADAQERTCIEIMVPRTEIVAFPVETAPGDLLDQLLASRYTRVPIYRGSIDGMVGIVHVKDVARAAREDGQSLQEFLRPVLHVSGRKPILRLLREMQAGFFQLAIVQDEFGVTQGLVTQEDILEEIVGEIRDEFDREELLTIRSRPDGGWEALGRVRVADFNRETGASLPSEPGDTLGGLVFHGIGRSARPGEVVRVAGYAITVMEVSGRRIRRVRVSPETEAAAAAPSRERDEKSLDPSAEKV